MPYSYATLTDAKVELARRLYDPSNLFWSADELTLYIQTALRTWNSLTNYFRSEFILQSIANQTWYDITSLVDAPNTNRPLTLTSTDLTKQIEYHLLEPPTGVNWTGSLQFNINDILGSIQRRRDEVLSNTTSYVTRSLIGAPTNSNRVFVNDTVIDIRRLAWIPVASPAGYSTIAVMPDDQYSAWAYEPDSLTAQPGSPSLFTQSTEPPLSFDVDITPAVPGSYELLTTNAGPLITVSSSPVLLYVPDDFTWVLTFGALADLLNRESNAKDTLRAQYCEARYKQGMALLLMASSVLFADIADVPMDIESATALDKYDPTWQSRAAGTPTTLVIGGLNLVGLSTTPDSNLHSLRIRTVQNAPVPTLDGDFIQLGRDDYDVLLDYAQHLAAFKMGGVEFMNTMAHFNRFIKQATLYNSKLSQMSEFKSSMFGQSQEQSSANPVFNLGADVASQGVL